jgi:hypothetical protein
MNNNNIKILNAENKKIKYSQLYAEIIKLFGSINNAYKTLGICKTNLYEKIYGNIVFTVPQTISVMKALGYEKEPMQVYAKAYYRFFIEPTMDTIPENLCDGDECGCESCVGCEYESDPPVKSESDTAKS